MTQGNYSGERAQYDEYIDPTGKSITSEIATVGQIPTGGTSTSLGTYATHLDGSNDTNNPQPGLTNAIINALDAGKSYINVTGAWRMNQGINSNETRVIDASDFPKVGIKIDCSQGAFIDYRGSGFAFEHISNSEPGQALSGEIFQIIGGTWASNGTPDGFVRLEDTSHAQLYPIQTVGFHGAAGGSAIYQVDTHPDPTQARWCENNNFGGRHHIIDVGIRDNGTGTSIGTSYQDNYVDDIHFGGIKDYGFDLSGNWIDCKFENPTTIVSEENATALRLNGNLDGSTFDNLELEDAAATLANYYLVEIGPDAAGRGPVFQGGKSDFNRDNEGMKYVNDSNATGNWVFWLNETEQKRYNRYCFSDDGHSRLRMTPSGVYRDTATVLHDPNDPNFDPWTNQSSL